MFFDRRSFQEREAKIVTADEIFQILRTEDWALVEMVLVRPITEEMNSQKICQLTFQNSDREKITFKTNDFECVEKLIEQIRRVSTDEPRPRA